ncbi:CPBP family intramembrane glutamic endopeptidase [Halorarius litoreus]|uniref:CPBP family intramembrane glutamic endopeptidase n=1 Tax=Halorarius litoreus TaxID=2962676 RepID=UPI0020CD41E2|nr:CPBP family intramembrane glutamic endopeptidase [Halorarius litoreus]
MATETSAASSTAPSDGPLGSYLWRAGTAFLLGLVGLLALGWYTASYGRPPGLDPLTAFVATVVNNGLLLVVLVLLGAYAAPRVGLRSHLLARTAGDRPPDSSFGSELPLAVGLGLVGAVAVLLLDVAFAPFVAAALAQLPQQTATVESVLAFTPVRFLYGGITEELLLRFGLMSLFVFLGARLFDRETATPSAGVVWGAILLSSLLFGVGHLPAASATFGGLDPVIVARTVLLNTVAGVAFGWLYWRRSLEAAMVAHGTFHVLFVALSLVVVLV